MLPLLLLGLAAAAYYYGAPKSPSNTVSIVMSAPASLSGDAAMEELAAAFHIDKTTASDGTITSWPGIVVFTIVFKTSTPKLPAVGTSAVILGVPVKIISILWNPTAIGPQGLK